MMELVKLNTPSGLVLWAHLSGQWSGAAFDRLAARIAGMALPAGSQVVLDFSAIDHLDYRAVPRLIRLAAGSAGRQEELRVVGFSPYLRSLVVFGGALDGCEFLERHVASGVPRSPAAAARGGAGTAPVDAWARSLASVARPAAGSRLPRLALRRVTLQAFAGLLAPSVN